MRGHVNPPAPLAVRGDILVKSQHVRWVVFFLDLYQTSIVRPIARADELVTRISQLIDIDAVRKGFQSIACSLDPSHHLRFLSGSVPNTCHVYFIARFPESKCGRGRTYTADSSTQRHKD